VKIRMIKVTLYPTEGQPLFYAKPIEPIEIPDAGEWIARMVERGCGLAEICEDWLKNLRRVLEGMGIIT